MKSVDSGIERLTAVIARKPLTGVPYHYQNDGKTFEYIDERIAFFHNKFTLITTQSKYVFDDIS